MDDRYLVAENLFSDGNFLETLDVLNEVLKNDERNIDFLLMRSKVSYRMQKWGEALNDLNLILEIDSDNQMAKSLKIMVMNIISFWNKDNYNP